MIDDEKENIYPKLDEFNTITDFKSASAPSDLGYKNDQLKININQLRIENFMNEKKVLEDSLSHYNKLKNKWTKIDSTLKYSILGVGGILTISATLLPTISGLGLLPTITLYCGVGAGLLSTISTCVSESFHIGLSSKKKKIYREICEAIKHGIDKLYVFQLKALEDNILTEDEILKAKDIIKDLREEILKIKDERSIKLENKLRNEAKREYKKELKQKYREELKSYKFQIRVISSKVKISAPWFGFYSIIFYPYFIIKR